VTLLENEGVDKFVVSWNELLQTVQSSLDAAAAKVEA
jgi:transaldolase